MEGLKCLPYRVLGLQAAVGRQIAIDGKMLRGGVGQSPLLVVSARSADFHLPLGQLSGDEISNEISAVRELVKLLDLAVAVVAIDALSAYQTQPKVGNS